MYTIQQLAKLANITTRTLRYYDEINLLSPSSYTDGGHRLYDQKAVERLQKIMFYRTFQFSLKQIHKVIEDERYFECLLKEQQKQIRVLEKTITETLESLGGNGMTNERRFKGLQKDVERNERFYGKELRETYGDACIDRSNEKYASLTEHEYEKMKQLEQQIIEQLKTARIEGIASKEAERLVQMHKQWLLFSWETYQVNAHKGLAMLYVTDKRLMHYYDQHGEGFAQFLCDAIQMYA